MSAPATPGAYEMETASGRRVDLFVPTAGTIALGDVAHGLSLACRFGGQCSRFYSVAEHAELVSRKLELEGRPDLAMAGLHHDDAEAYLGDVPRPLKLVLDRLVDPDGPEFSYRDLEGDFDGVIQRALAWTEDGGNLWTVDQFEDPDLKAADAWALLVEARALVPSGGRRWGVEEWALDGVRWPIERPPWWVGGLSPEGARLLWLRRHETLAARA